MSGCNAKCVAVPGKEAEELRAGIEKLVDDGSRRFITSSELQSLLDRVCARDSLAFLEAGDQEYRQLRALRSESIVDEYPFAAQFLDRAIAAHRSKP